MRIPKFEKPPAWGPFVPEIILRTSCSRLLQNEQRSSVVIFFRRQLPVLQAQNFNTEPVPYRRSRSFPRRGAERKGSTVLQLYGNVINQIRFEVEDTDSKNTLLFSLFSGNSVLR
jgi:hypothetical protein